MISERRNPLSFKRANTKSESMPRQDSRRPRRLRVESASDVECLELFSDKPLSASIEGISEATVKAGAVYKYDLSIPVEKLYAIVEEMRLRLGQTSKVLGYGHLGDGNLHLNITTPQYDDNVLAQIEPFVYQWTSKHRGSISAEHGLGLMKAEKIHYSKSLETVQLMASIKKLLDPKRILNPYKVLPQSMLHD